MKQEIKDLLKNKKGNPKELEEVKEVEESKKPEVNEKINEEDEKKVNIEILNNNSIYRNENLIRLDFISQQLLRIANALEEEDNKDEKDKSQY